MYRHVERPESTDIFISEAMRNSAALAQRLRGGADRRTPEQIRTRLADPPQLAPVTGQPMDASLRAETAEAVVHLMTSGASGTPAMATEEEVREIENTWRATESVVEQWYREWPEYRWMDLLPPTDDRLRRLADDAAARFSVTTAPGMPAIVASCKPDQPWILHGPGDLTDAMAGIAGAIHCDLEISGPLVIDRKRWAKCVDWYRHWLQIVKRADGDNGQLQREFFEQNFVTLPVARGDLIVLVRACQWCLGAFCGKNAIDPAESVISEPYSDGFGSVPWSEKKPPAENVTGEAGRISSDDDTSDR